MVGDRVNLLGLPRTELEAFVAERLGAKPFRARQLMKWIYRRGAADFAAMSDLKQDFRAQLKLAATITVPEIVTQQQSSDGTRKWMLRMDEVQGIETVYIPEPGRGTLCISSQVGCAMDCTFCATAQQGFNRNLSVAEIVGQVWLAHRELADAGDAGRADGRTITNIVFMGMGEPLANYDALIRALTIINAEWGLGFGARRITVSTSGLVPKIIRLAGEPLGFRLAISLHGATDEVRTRIMPVNKAYPLAKLLPAIKTFTERHGRMVTLEFILIRDVNDSPDQARRLRDIALDLHAHVNLIPYNTVEGLPWKRPEVARQLAFAEILERSGVSVTLRREKGHDIAAACGQLRLKTERERGDSSGALEISS